MGHSNTVYNQVLQIIDRHKFNTLTNKYKPKRRYRKFDQWNQFSVMIFAQLTGCTGLRHIENQFKFHENLKYHSGLKSIKRSTISDANNSRDPEIFKELYYQQYQSCIQHVPGHKFKFKNKLFSLDASTIGLNKEKFLWAKFKKSKSGIRIHTLLNHDGYIPSFIEITDAKTHEVKIAQTLSFKPGSIIAMDKGYIDYDLLYRINQNDSFFVSRQKSNMNYRTVDRRTVLKNKGLTSDNTIKITGSKKEAYPKSLRRIGYKDPETGKRYFFITNNFKLAAKTIADIYKERWQVELFFKWIKQNLRIKKFYGTSRNAVYTQIWIALTTMLLLAFLKYKAKLSWSLYELLSLLRLMLFEKKNIWKLFKPDKNYYTIGDQMLFDFSNL